MEDLKKLIKFLGLENNLIVRFIKLKKEETECLVKTSDFYNIPSANSDDYKFSLDSFSNHIEKFNNWNKYGQVFFSPLGISEINEDVNPNFIFYEIDDYSILENPEIREKRLQVQIEKAKELEKELKVKVTLVKTFKSIHCYIKLNKSITKNEWVYFQKRLIQKMDSDKSLINSNRLMRLPSFLHTRVFNGELNYTPVELIQLGDSSDKADLDLLDNKVLPEYDMDFWEPYEVKAQVLRQKKSGINFVDLADNYLESFNINGRKGWATCKCPAHNGKSTDSLHINKTTGAFKCWSGCDSKEVFNKTLEIAKDQGYKPPYGSETIIYYLEVFQRITGILLDNPDPFVREVKINQIKTELNFKDNDIWKKLQDLANKELENNNVANSIELISKIFNNYIEVGDIFPKQIAEFIKISAVNLGHEPIILGTLFISYILPFIQNKITLDIYGDGTFTDKLLMFHVLVGSTGVGKTGLMKVFGKYLKEIQKEFDIQYKTDQKNYKTDPETYPEPKQRILWTGDTTEAARFSIMQEPDYNSTLLEVDEMSSLFDKIKNNSATDPHFLQNILSIYNCQPLSRTTKSDGTLSVNLNYSIIGGIQPEELDKTINFLSGDPKGFLPRFMFSVIKHNSEPDFKNHIKLPDFNVKDFMLKLESLSAKELTFTEEALKLLGLTQTILLEKRDNYNSKEFTAAIPKFITQMYRFSGIIHVINKTFNNEEIGLIDVDDVESANILITYFLSNYRLLFPKTLEEKVYQKALEKGSLKWYDLKNITFKNFIGDDKNVRDLNDILYIMSELGFGDFEWCKTNKTGLFSPSGINENNLRFLGLKYALLLNYKNKIDIKNIKECIKNTLIDPSDTDIEINFYKILDFISNFVDGEVQMEDNILKLNNNYQDEFDYYESLIDVYN